MKRYRHWPIYLLLLLLPMQSIAAANMLVCNSLMQQAMVKVATEMPCHQQVADLANLQTHEQQSEPAKPHTDHKSISHCGMLCNSLCSFTALPATTFNLLKTHRTVLIAATEVDYHSVTLPLLQRPPIFLA